MVGIASIKDWTEAGKNLFALLRDFLLFILFAVLIWFPGQIGEWFDKSKLKSFKGLGVELEARAVQDQAKETLAVGADLAATKAQNTEIQKKLDALVKLRPDVAAEVAPVQAQIAQSQQTLTAADARLANTVVSQQNLLEKTGVTAAALQGWIYLGSVDERKSRWIKQNVDGDWPIKTGEMRTARDALFVRAVGSKNNRAAARPLGAVAKGRSIQIEEIDTTGHLLAGGWTVWARVTVQP